MLMTGERKVSYDPYPEKYENWLRESILRAEDLVGFRIH